MVSDLLYHLDTLKSMGQGGIHPGVLRELAKVLTEPLSMVPVEWKLPNVTPIDKKGRKEDPTCQPDLGTVGGYGADPLECHHAAHTGQPGDQAQSV